MKRYVFIITDCNRSILQVGLSADLRQSMKFYRQMPNLLFNPAQQLGRLVYFEELNSEADALQRFERISSFTRLQKERLIRTVNADWIDLNIGLDFEAAGYAGFSAFNKASAISSRQKTNIQKRLVA